MELEQIIREIYRVPISNEDRVTVEIDGADHEVINLGGHGIGIRLDRADAYAVDDTPHSVLLRLEGHTLLLQGKVVHITPVGKGYHLCGINLLDLDEKSKKIIHNCIYRIRTRLFTKN